MLRQEQPNQKCVEANQKIKVDHECEASYVAKNEIEEQKPMSQKGD
jgi:hypothetical protein